MYRGTTPTLTFTFTEAISTMSEVWITFKQSNKEVFTKVLDDCTISGAHDLVLVLTQEDTLALSSGYLEIQIRVRYADGTAGASDIIKSSIERILKDGVIS